MLSRESMCCGVRSPVSASTGWSFPLSSALTTFAGHRHTARSCSANEKTVPPAELASLPHKQERGKVRTETSRWRAQICSNCHLCNQRGPRENLSLVSTQSALCTDGDEDRYSLTTGLGEGVLRSEPRTTSRYDQLKRLRLPLDHVRSAAVERPQWGVERRVVTQWSVGAGNQRSPAASIVVTLVVCNWTRNHPARLHPFIPWMR